MRFSTLIPAALLVCAGVASADRCIGPMDTSDLVVTTYGIAPFATADIVWCDDFDSYCTANFGGDTNPTASVFWPGYPPNPDTTLCTGPTDTNEWLMKQGYWTQSPTPIGPLAWSWPAPARNSWVYPSGPGVPPTGGQNYGVVNGDVDNGGLRLEGWDQNPGWTSLPYVSKQGRNSGGAGYYDFLMSGAIAHRFPNSDAVNGTDANPLVLRYWRTDNINLSQSSQPAWGQIPNSAFYMELALDADRAPTDFIMAASTIQQCVDENVNWPIICSQNVNPAGCPDRTAFPLAVHASLAFGWLSPLDTNPCNVETGRKPTMYHAATFNGKTWKALVANQNPGNGGDFNYDMQMGFFEITVKSTTYEVRMIAPNGATSYTIDINTAILPREYTGPFNKVAMGIGPGCELDPATGDCKSGSSRDYSKWNWAWAAPYVDRPVVFGGVGNQSTGACCIQTGSEAGTCTDNVSHSECAGVWHGANTTCATTLCCPLPFADADHDGDVDQDDFGAFQVCYTGAGGGVPTGCSCFDRNSDGNVDGTDLQSFTNCWTGPNVTWTAALTPSCAP